MLEVLKIIIAAEGSAKSDSHEYAMKTSLMR